MGQRKNNPYFACQGVLEGCNFVCSGFAQRNRLAPHAVNCQFLSSELKDLVMNQAASSSLEAKKEARDSENTDQPPSKSYLNLLLSYFKISIATESKSIQPLAKKQKLASKLVHNFSQAGREQLNRKINFIIVKLICVNGLVPRILDSDEELMNALNPKYKVTGSDKFEHQYIPNEAQHVQKKVLGILRGLKNLTLSFDGNTIRKQQSVYTMHVSKRAGEGETDSYFVKGIQHSDLHHDADWVADRISEVFFSLFSNSNSRDRKSVV